MISSALRQIADDIDGGNCDMNENDALNIFEQIKDMRTNNAHLSKCQACKHLNVSRATFDRLVSEGKLPKGEKRVGFKELSWRKSDLIL